MRRAVDVLRVIACVIVMAVGVVVFTIGCVLVRIAEKLDPDVSKKMIP